MSDDAVAPVLPVRNIAAAARFIGEGLPVPQRGTAGSGDPPAVRAAARLSLPAEFSAPSRVLGWQQTAPALMSPYPALFAPPLLPGPNRSSGPQTALPAAVDATPEVEGDPQTARREAVLRRLEFISTLQGGAFEANAAANGTARVSDLGRLLVQMHHRLEAPSAESRPPDTRMPLVAEGDDAPEIAARLHESVSRTGLHYESHLAAWTRGAWPLEALRAEPQAAWPRSLAIGEPQVRAAGEAGEEGRAGPDAAKGDERVTDSPRESRATPAEAMVRRQLDALERGEISWRGEVWPGRWVELAVREESRHGPAPGPGATSGWTARLRLEMPDLGPVAATVTLLGGTGSAHSGGSAAFTLRAARPEAGNRLAEDAARLAGGLDARGLRLGSISVRHDPSA